MAVIMDGKALSDKILLNLKGEISNCEKKPTLAVILVGSNPASEIYVNIKEKTAQNIGIKSMIFRFPKETEQSEIESLIKKLNNDSAVNAILLQLPLPGHLDAYKLIETIDPKKDVDGLHPVNMGRLFMGLTPYCFSCTPLGIMTLLKEYNIDVEGKKVLTIGRSNIVGKPVSAMLLKHNATVAIAHSKSVDLKQLAIRAEIIISAVGQPNLITKDMVSRGTVVIDVGISRTKEGKIKGDIDFEGVSEVVDYITPVPKGVGPMTIAMLMQNTFDLFKRSQIQ